MFSDFSMTAGGVAELTQGERDNHSDPGPV